jgi:hypothetical protein
VRCHKTSSISMLRPMLRIESSVLEVENLQSFELKNLPTKQDCHMNPKK